MARTAKLDIQEDFINDLMALHKVDSLTELSRAIDIDVDTLRGWAFKRSSPINSLEIALKLQKAFGKPLPKVIKVVKGEVTTD